MVLLILMSTIFTGQFTARTVPSVPAQTPNADFPLRVQLQVINGGSTFSYSGYGRGNIVKGTTPLGFDFVESCDQNFSQNRDPGQYYQARWKTRDRRLEILLQEIGSKHTSRCELDVTVRTEPYNLYAHGQAIPLSPPAVPATTLDPAFPARVQLIVTHSNGLQSEGRGNVLGAPSVGFDFVSNCDRHFFSSRDPKETFQAHWLEANHRLSILFQDLGSDKTTTCELAVATRSAPYDLVPGKSVSVATPLVPPLRVVLPVTAANPDHPLHIQLRVWHVGVDDPVDPHSSGLGNLLMSPHNTGFAFQSLCDPHIGFSQDVYRARWKVKDELLEVLVLDEVTQQPYTCQLQVKLREGPNNLHFTK